MTNNLDQFDQSPDFDEAGEGQENKGLKSNLAEAWRTRPIFKLIVMLIVLGGIVVAAITMTTSKPEEVISKVSPVPGLDEKPGGTASPEFIKAQEEANAQRIREAAAGTNPTALPTPLPSGISVEARKEGDPLVEFRAEMKRQKEEQQRQIQALQQQNQQQQQVTIQQDQQLQEKLGQAFTQQMTQLAELWKPKGMEIITGVADSKDDGRMQQQSGAQQQAVSTSGSSPQSTNSDNIRKKVKPLIPAGAVHYAQLLTEANSDVPGPILAQILSGPLSGGRAIGKFTVMNDLLTIDFSTAILKSKEYQIEALALDPDTTLGGMATEVDHRYFARVVLPAAGAFISAFGQKLSEKPVDTVVTQGGTVISQQAKNGIEDGLYAGMGQAGQTVSQFFTNEAANTKVLVRVAVGTPMGLFFTRAVCSGEYPCQEKEDADQPQSSTSRPLINQQATGPVTPVAATPVAATPALGRGRN